MVKCCYEGFFDKRFASFWLYRQAYEYLRRGLGGSSRKNKSRLAKQGFRRRYRAAVRRHKLGHRALGGAFRFAFAYRS